MTENERVTATATLVDGLQMVGESSSGHPLVMDGAAGFGREAGIRPLELLLVGLAGCTGMDVAHILRKRRKELRRFQVRVNARRAPMPPRVYTDIEIEYHVTGPDIKPKELEMAIELSATTFCAASEMLGKAARISHKYFLDGAEGRSEVTLAFD
jgi:putative redox protein